MILFISVIIIILYLYSIISKLDRLDFISLYWFIRYSNNDIEITPLKNLLTFIYQFIFIPFHDKTYFSKLSEGGVYSSYISKYYPKLDKKLNDKLYWNKMFNKYGINHPQLIAYVQNNKLHVTNNINNNKYYICKPINGALGYKIFRIKGDEIKRTYYKYNNVIFQQMLVDCYTNKIRHFRYVTLYNGKPFRLLQITGLKHSITSNGGKFTFCNKQGCNHLSYTENYHLENICKNLSYMHKAKFSNIFSIGWDIMLDCSNNVSKAYCLEGNIRNSTWRINEKDQALISSYKNKLLIFLKKNHINLAF